MVRASNECITKRLRFVDEKYTKVACQHKNVYERVTFDVSLGESYTPSSEMTRKLSTRLIYTDKDKRLQNMHLLVIHT